MPPDDGEKEQLVATVSVYFTVYRTATCLDFLKATSGLVKYLEQDVFVEITNKMQPCIRIYYPTVH